MEAGHQHLQRQEGVVVVRLGGVGWRGEAGAAGSDDCLTAWPCTLACRWPVWQQCALAAWAGAAPLPCQVAGR